MIRLKTLFVLLICAFSTTISAQSKQLKKADQLYKINSFAEAIPAYEAALQEKYSISAETKLAKCYFMLNNMDKAEKLYAKIVQQNKAKPITYFNYAETLMSKSKYDQAKVWFKKYLEEKPNDVNAKTKLLACDMVQTIQPYFQEAVVKKFQHNSEFDDTAPVVLGEELVFASDRKVGPKLLKQKSGWTGRDYINIYTSTITGGNEFGEPSAYSKFNGINKNTGSVSFNKDATEAYFTRNGDVSNRREEYTMQLYKAVSDDGKKWKNITPLAFCKVEYNYMHPFISPDGKKLFFVTDKPGGEGGTDIYFSERKADGAWGRPQNIGPSINTEGHEGYPFLGADSKLYFCSKGHAGFGGFDIFYTEQKTSGLWKKPINIGKPVNSSLDDISLFLLDNNEGWFTSSREGGDDDIYQFSYSGISSGEDLTSSYGDDQADHSIFGDGPDVIVQEQKKVEETPVEPPKTYSEILAMQNAAKQAKNESLQTETAVETAPTDNAEEIPAVVQSDPPKEEPKATSDVAIQTQPNTELPSEVTESKPIKVEKPVERPKTYSEILAMQNAAKQAKNETLQTETAVEIAPTDNAEEIAAVVQAEPSVKNSKESSDVAIQTLPNTEAQNEIAESKPVEVEKPVERPKTYSEIIAMQNQGVNPPSKEISEEPVLESEVVAIENSETDISTETNKTEISTNEIVDKKTPAEVVEQSEVIRKTAPALSAIEPPDFKEEEIGRVQNEQSNQPVEGIREQSVVQQQSEEVAEEFEVVEQIETNTVEAPTQVQTEVIDADRLDPNSYEKLLAEEPAMEIQKEELSDLPEEVIADEKTSTTPVEIDSRVAKEEIATPAEEEMVYEELDIGFDEIIEPVQQVEAVTQTESIESPARSNEPMEEEDMYLNQPMNNSEPIVEQNHESESDILEPEPILFDTENNELDTKIVSENDLLVSEVIEPKPVQVGNKKSKSKSKKKSKSVELPALVPNSLNVPSSGVYFAENGINVFSDNLFDKNIAIGHSYLIPNADYGFNKYDVPFKLSIELDKLVSILQTNKKVSIEMVGHTASFGEHENNLQLSINRAKSASDYLIEKGISSDRITFNGFGESNLRNKCIDGVLCSLEEHKQNERLEILITKVQ